jgi:hypothetical protein
VRERETRQRLSDRPRNYDASMLVERAEGDAMKLVL